MESVEKECGALGGLFQAVVNDMKNSYPVWEDFSAKATKLHSQLRTTVLATAAFLDAFQKVADMATNTRGATRDIGSALTRMCMRHRSIEAKLRHFTNALMERLITPLQDKIEEWKKTAALLDKDHAKEYKRSRQEIKKKSSDTLKLQKKARKELPGRGGLQPQLDSAMQDVSDMYLLMEETEKQAVRRALLEERGRYCTFISFLQPVVNGEIAMLGEVTHLQAIIDDLTVLTTDPHKLPEASEQVILDLKGSDYSWSYQTPPSSPSSTGSRKSSLCSLVHLPPGGAHRLSSVSSHDSGFISQDANMHSKPPSPMPSDITSQKSSSSASSEASETCQSVSECGSPTAFGSSFATFRPAHTYNGSIRPLSFIAPASPSFNHSPGSNSPSPTSKVPHWKQDWSKAAHYEQAGAALQRKMEAAEPPGGPRGNGVVHAEDPYRTRAGPANISGKHGKLTTSAASELAMVLTRGLSLEQQKNSCDSLQYSSGYSTQNTTPSCSEDTIPSHGSDYDCYSMNGDGESDAQTDFDKSSTVPRHSNLAQNYRRMIQTKRPASTAGLPGGVGAQGSSASNGKGTSGGTVISSGTATIRRTPSSKTGVRRVPSNVGPIPIRPPIVPVKTPTVPDSPGFPSPPPEHNGSEESLYSEDSLEILEYKASPKRMSLPNSAWGSSMSVYSQQSGAMALSTEEQILAANRHSLVEKIGELVANAHALGEGQYPFPTDPQASHGHQEDPPPTEKGEDMLKSIRRGVRLRKTVSNDRSAPRILR
ncbi:MTSS I-BAR domain containing 2a isoform X1 [Astyanax mexicanus]|uniref:MTSS I-BAR domain containing 2a isoform X1 n=2 Tax=Astyanax mexicanus TaxID=7994 RepID=UPI0020CACBC5|nr:MTSS I-BAR domain containing 2a isoform X1 [Astyanax mexicanus]